jgi:hypothetical protein
MKGVLVTPFAFLSFINQEFIMSDKTKALIIRSIKLDEELQANAVTLSKFANTKSLKAWRNYVAGIVQEHYDNEQEAYESRNAPHWLTFKKDTKQEQMLDKFHKLHKDATRVQSSGNAEPVAIPAQVTKQVKVLVREVVASGMTRKQFDAMVSELRSSIDFK